MKKKSQVQTIKEYVLENPDATPKEVAKKLKVSKQAVYNARHRLNAEGELNSEAETAQEPNGYSDFRVDINIPEYQTLTLRLKSNARLLGTFHIDAEGFVFLPPSFKKKPEGKVSWKMLSAVQTFLTD